MKKKIFIPLLVICIIISMSVVAFAEVLGGKWNVNPKYNADSLSTSYKSSIETGVSRWNSALSTIGVTRRISYSTVTSQTVNANETDYGATGWNAEGRPGPDYASGIYTYATIKLNTYYMDDFTTAKKKAIATHEWGHVLGLAHTIGTTNRSLMYEGGSSVYYDVWGISSPNAYDRSTLDSIY